MHEGTFGEVVEKIRGKDPRYDAEAYFFVREALDFTSQMLNKPAEGSQRHVTGQELLEGVRSFALQEFGPIASTVLKTWGITKTGDFGNIVFNLVEEGVLGKTDKDSKKDFNEGYDFKDAFTKPFLPKTKKKARATKEKNAPTAKKQQPRKKK